MWERGIAARRRGDSDDESDEDEGDGGEIDIENVKKIICTLHNDDDVLGTDDAPAFYTIVLVRTINTARRSDDEDTDVHLQQSSVL